jgi:predicted CopG family antitoxin
MAAKKSKAKGQLLIQLDPKHRKKLEGIKANTGASFSEIIRRMIDGRKVGA